MDRLINCGAMPIGPFCYLGAVWATKRLCAATEPKVGPSGRRARRASLDASGWSLNGVNPTMGIHVSKIKSPTSTQDSCPSAIDRLSTGAFFPKTILIQCALWTRGVLANKSDRSQGSIQSNS